MTNAADTTDWHWRSFYVSRGGDVSGPFTAAQVRGLWQRGEITLADHLCLAGTEQWIATDDARAFLDELPAPESRPPIRVVIDRPLMDPGQKKMLYFLAAFLIGPLGIHNILAGEWGEFAAKLSLGILAAVLWSAGAVVLPWCIWVVIFGWSLFEANRGPRNA